MPLFHHWGFGPGWGGPYCDGSCRGFYGSYGPGPGYRARRISKQDEVEMLREDAKALEAELQDIKERLKELGA